MVATGSGKGGQPGPTVDTETYEDVQFEMDDQSSCADVTMDEMQSGSPSHSILRGSYLLDEAINKQIVKAKQRLQVLEAQAVDERSMTLSRSSIACQNANESRAKTKSQQDGKRTLSSSWSYAQSDRSFLDVTFSKLMSGKKIDPQKAQSMHQDSICSARNSEVSPFHADEVNIEAVSNIQCMDSSSSSILRANHMLNASINKKIAELKKNMQDPEDDASSKPPKRSVRFSEDGRSSRSTSWWPTGLLGRHISAPELQPTQLQGSCKETLQSVDRDSICSARNSQVSTFHADDVNIEAVSNIQCMDSSSSSILRANHMLNASINTKIAELKKNMQDPEDVSFQDVSSAKQPKRFSEDCRSSQPKSWWEGVLRSSHTSLKAKPPSADNSSASGSGFSGSSPSVPKHSQCAADDVPDKVHGFVQCPSSVSRAHLGMNAATSNKNEDSTKQTQKPEDDSSAKPPKRSVRFSEDCRTSRPKWESGVLKVPEPSQLSHSSLKGKMQSADQDGLSSSRNSKGLPFSADEANSETTRTVPYMASSSSSILRANHMLNASINKKIAELKKNMQDPEDNAPTKHAKTPFRHSEDGRSSQSKSWWPTGLLGRHGSTPTQSPTEQKPTHIMDPSETTQDHSQAVAHQSSLFHIPAQVSEGQATEDQVAAPPLAKENSVSGVQEPSIGVASVVAGDEAGSAAWEDGPASPATVTLRQAVRASLTWLPGYQLVAGVLGAVNSIVFGTSAAAENPKINDMDRVLSEPVQMDSFSKGAYGPENSLMELFKATSKEFALSSASPTPAAKHTGSRWSMESAAEIHAEALRLGSFSPPRVLELRNGVSRKSTPKARMPRPRSASMDQARRSKSRFSLEVNRLVSLPENIAISSQTVQ
eukprot:CAMPEP_0114288684 /NCGR_PEP_ID=MMETSP0059-20121206/6950_1 /TAXON_ID=36894 /ORGANISM="Pyramimonas parkeae, Strain CCMP726" /LENGTH=878 /DNA_ID=CAMNT_0001409863 /DNA_START=936 /DNA_END=3572 /DNA_ORIENTATION=-